MFYFPFFQSHTSNKPLNAISLQKCSLHMLIGHLIKKSHMGKCIPLIWLVWDIEWHLKNAKTWLYFPQCSHIVADVANVSHRYKGVKWTPNGGMRSQIGASDGGWGGQGEGLFFSETDVGNFCTARKTCWYKISEIKRKWVDRGGSQEGHINILFSEWWLN